MKHKKIGLFIADQTEYEPLRAVFGDQKIEERPLFGLDGLKICGNMGGEELEIYAVRGGIGKVNAAAVCALLVKEGCDIIVNFGLCGGLSGARDGDIIICKDYVEHDMDLSPLGKKPTQLSEGEYYVTPQPYIDILKQICPQAKVGKIATGDSFVSDNKTAAFLENIGAIAVDMEATACAQVCQLCDVPFVSFKQVSDNADDSAGQDYRDMCETVLDQPAHIFREFLSHLNKLL